MNEIIYSVQSHTTVQTKIEGSRFIVDVIPAIDEEIAVKKLETVKKKYFDATHHCYAYVIGVEKNNVRYSDDGEPSGTAGVKIYSAIQSKNLSDILLVVTRYFGGTKLGVGGLGRAYFESAENGINHAVIISKALIQEMKVAFPFSETNPVMNIIKSNKLKISATNYTDECAIVTIQILPSLISSIRDLFMNATRGSSEITIGEKKTVNWQ